MGPPGHRFSVRATVLAAACAVAAMVLVAGAVSWVVYARIESLLVDVSEVQAHTLAHALRLADTSNRYAAGGGEIAAARNQLQRQNAAVALAQQAQALYEAIEALRRAAVTATDMTEIEALVLDLEQTLLDQNRLVEERIDREARARRLRGELNRLQADFDRLADRIVMADPWTGTPGLFESSAVRAMLRLYEVGQIEHVPALEGARASYREARERLDPLADRLLAGSPEQADARRLVALLDTLAEAPDGVFPVREALIRAQLDTDAKAAQARELATRLGIAVGRLVAAVEAQTETTKAAVRAQIDAGRRWLYLIALATFLGPVVLVWLAVGRSIVRPLARLAKATRRIADGDLQTPIPATHHREFQAIGDALAVFRDNTAALADRTRALQHSEEAERNARREAEAALADLREAQEQLVQAEKMAALASLVAGVAHEINTPIGITLTSASLLSEEVAAMAGATREGTLRRSEFEQFLERLKEIAGLMQANMERAASLVHAFKQVAADQSHDQRRPFELCETLEQTLISLRPACQKAGHRTTLSCPAGLVADSYPGALSQVLTILVMNALDHAFDAARSGVVTIAAAVERDTTIRIDVTDNGRGIPADLQRRVFEPFFTTRRSAGNTGLGLHIAYNVVRQTLKGRIDLMPGPGGAHFVIRMPLALPVDPAGEAAQPVTR